MSHPPSVEEVQSPLTKVQIPGLGPVECNSVFFTCLFTDLSPGGVTLESPGQVLSGTDPLQLVVQGAINPDSRHCPSEGVRTHPVLEKKRRQLQIGNVLKYYRVISIATAKTILDPLLVGQSYHHLIAVRCRAAEDNYKLV